MGPIIALNPITIVTESSRVVRIDRISSLLSVLGVLSLGSVFGVSRTDPAAPDMAWADSWNGSGWLVGLCRFSVVWAELRWDAQLEQSCVVFGLCI